MGIEAGKVFWDAVRGNLEKLNEAKDLWQIIEQATPIIEDDDREFIDTARACLPDGELTSDTWSQWLAAIKQASDRKGRGLFMPSAQSVDRHGAWSGT